jgi:tetratricopeptide (TPR) repeat protein
LHPLHVESVAWVAERKDVLSAFFFLLTLSAYVRYAELRQPTSRQDKQQSGTCPPPPLFSSAPFLRLYSLSLVCFALGLMSKPMLVTLPGVLLLLDYWPLRRLQTTDLRFQSPILRPLLWEKIPFLFLSVAASIVTYLVQARWFSVAPTEALSLGARVTNAIASYCKYLGKTFWPVDLAIFYPHAGFTGSGLASWPAWQIALAALALAMVSTGALLAWKRQPWFATGWFWYLGMLVPVIGLVQVGRQAMADRYSYLPLIGIFICLVWGLSDWFSPRRFGRKLLAVLGWVTVVACLVMTRQQVGYWQNNLTLFQRALAVTSQNSLAHFILAMELTSLGRTSEAVEQYEAGLRINPNDASAHNNLGVMLLKLGRPEGAVQHYLQALQLNPNYAEPHYNLGFLLASSGQLEQSASYFAAALRFKPDYPDALKGLGNVLIMQGKLAEAQTQFENLVRLAPANADARVGLGEVLVRQGRAAEALPHFAEAVRLDPGRFVAHYNLGSILLEQRKFAEAEIQLAEAVRLDGNDAAALIRLARAQARQGKIHPATTSYAQAINLSPNSAEPLGELAWLLATYPDNLYRNGSQAVRLAERACQLSGGREARFWATLDAAYAEVGRFPDAIKAAEKTRALALAAGQTELAQAAADRLALYAKGEPYRQ